MKAFFILWTLCIMVATLIGYLNPIEDETSISSDNDLTS